MVGATIRGSTAALFCELLLGVHTRKAGIHFFASRAVTPDEAPNGFEKGAVFGQLAAVAARAQALRDWFKPFGHKHVGKP